MRAVIYQNYGPPDVLKIVEKEKPVPKENEVLVKIRSAAVTAGDVRLRKAEPFMVRLFFGLTKPRYQTPGVDFAGVIENVGNNVTEFKAGDEVFGSTFECGFGAHAEYKCIPEDTLISEKPENLSFEESSAVFFGGHTALHFLRKGKIVSNKKVLIYGASGSIGTYAIQLAKHFEAKVTGVCSTKNVDLVKSIGADKVIDYTKEDFTKSGEKYDIIFDTVGKSNFSGCVKSLNENGFYLRAVHMSPSDLLKGVITNLTTNKKVIGGVAQEKKEDLLFLKELIESGKIKPVVDKVYKLDQIKEAHSYVETGRKKGNVVLTIN